MSRRVGLIGLGKIVTNGHMPSYQAAGIEVVAAADSHAPAASAFADAFPAVRVSDDIRAVLEHPDVDVVDIATPPASHAELVALAAAAGKHILCQKPLSLDIVEAEGMVDVARRHGVQLAVNQNARFGPANSAIARWLAAGRIGQVHAAKIEYHATIPLDPWRATLQHFAVTDNLLHQIDLVRWWLGVPDRVFAAETRSASAEAEAMTYASVTMSYASGAVVNLVGDCIDPSGEPSNAGWIDGSEGAIKFEGSAAARVKSGRGEWEFGESADPALWRPGVGFLPGFARCMSGLLDALDAGVRPPTDAADNLKTLDLLFAIHRSLQSGDAVTVPTRGS